ncbi:sporulation integral membrane protein YtvI, partial [Alkalihalophilus pseudofirmus]|nr:sporulation integral membrane protein YtvI [Alkalihalophilus pseudofirmus]
MNPKYLYRTLRFLFVIGVVVLALLAFFYLSKITYPFIIALVIAFMINPLVNFFEK